MMQEQSQAPALGGRETQASFEALEGLMNYAKGRSSHQVLLMTWGYINGDGVKHPAIFPDYHAMQVRLLSVPPAMKLPMHHTFPLAAGQTTTS